MKKTAREVLGVSARATPEEIKQAYYRLVREHHSDLHGETPEAHAQMCAINAAYEQLTKHGPVPTPKASPPAGPVPENPPRTAIEFAQLFTRDLPWGVQLGGTIVGAFVDSRIARAAKKLQEKLLADAHQRELAAWHEARRKASRRKRKRKRRARDAAQAPGP